MLEGARVELPEASCASLATETNVTLTAVQLGTDDGPPLPSENLFRLADGESIAVDIEFDPPLGDHTASVCMTISAALQTQASSNGNDYVILHYTDGAWTELPTTVNTEDGTAVEACGTTTSLSPFLLALKAVDGSEQTAQPTVVPAPTPEPSPFPPDTGGRSPSHRSLLLLLLIGMAVMILAILMRPPRLNR